MPSYLFQCKNCDVVYEKLVANDPKNKYPSVVCPECASKKKKKLITNIINYTMKQLNGSRREDDFEYKGRHNAEMAKKTRAMAEERSHMGSGDEIYRATNDNIPMNTII